MPDTSFQDIRDLLERLTLSQLDTEARFKDTEARFKDTDVKFKQTDDRINRAFSLFESQWGKLIESLVEGDLVRILRKRNINISDTSTRRKGKRNGIDYEFDIIAHNGSEIVLVEVKTTLKVKHVNKFISRLEQAKQLLPEYQNFTIYGAIAFLQADEESDTYAEKQRLFVIRATGDSAAIANDPDFKPRKF